WAPRMRPAAAHRIPSRRPAQGNDPEPGYGSVSFAAMTKAPDQRVLAHAIDGIMASYAEHGNINHLDGQNLPSRAEVEQLLDDLVAILFPGYFVKDQLDELTARYFVGERCARVLR